MKRIFAVSLFLVSVVGMGLFCESRTKGFRLSEIFTHLENRPEWEVPALSGGELSAVKARLNQSFKYLGAGEQSVAFLGEDGKTVLKFFKHGSWLGEWLNRLQLPVALQKKRANLHMCRTFNPAPVFASCMIAYRDLKEEAGLLCLHLNKTTSEWSRVIVYDPIGVKQMVDLDATEFMVQEYGELAFATIDKQMKSGKMNEALASTQALLDSIERYSAKGVSVDHPAIQRNVGLIEGRALLLDVGSFKKSDDYKTRAAFEHEVMAVTHRLERWIRKHHPSLLPLFVEQRKQKLNGVTLREF